MKKLFAYILLLGGLLSSTSCSDFTDLQPKGKNLLTTTTQLEMLLNAEFYISSSDLPMMCGDMIYSFENVPTLINRPQKTRTSIILTWDESSQDNMAELTSSDGDYSDMYGIIGTIANPILSRVDEAEGTEAVKNQLKCEAWTLRAYFHYLLVNKFAKAYNPATAAEDGGIPYMTEDDDITAMPEKQTVQAVYDSILADAQRAIDLDALPATAVSRMRMNKACAYAVKAFALLSMQRFDEAEEAANQALALNSQVNDYNNMLTTVTGNITGGSYQIILRTLLECEEDLFYTHHLEFLNGITPYAWALFEEGHASHDKMYTMDMMYDYTTDYGMSLIGLPGYTYTYDLSSGWNYAGIKTTHMYLIVAEAEIRKGNYDAAMAALDKIRVNRIDPEVYQPLEGTVTTEDDAIHHLKQTSHGENIYSYWNFINRKRWNQVSGWEETFTHDFNGQVFTLTPESSMWVFPFPRNVTNLNPNMTQNY